MFEDHPEGIVLSVKAMPGSKKDEIRGVQDGSLKVCVTQIPEKGKANKAIRKQLAKSLGLRVSRIELLSGETAALKKFLIREITASDLQASIDRLTKSK